MASISVFSAFDRKFETYRSDSAAPEKGGNSIARLTGPANSSSLGGGVVVYEKLTVD